MRGADRVELTTDPVDGHPTSVLVDRDANAIDDEECYEVTEYTPEPSR